MSKLSVWYHQAAAFIANAVNSAPADQHAKLTDASNKLATAAQATDDALPTLAKVVLDAGLTAIGGGVYIPAFNEFADVLIAEIESRKTKAA